MRRVVWGIGIVMVVLWTLFSLGAYALVSLFGDLMVASSGTILNEPDIGAWAAWTFAFVRDFGLAILMLLWAVVSAAILAVTALLARLAGRDERLPRGPYDRIG